MAVTVPGCAPDEKDSVGEAECREHDFQARCEDAAGARMSGGPVRWAIGQISSEEVYPQG
jgi:hypothetical protein